MKLNEEKTRLLTQIAEALGSTGVYNTSTCDCDYYGWSSLRHQAMTVLSRQGIDGCRITHQYKFEVHDWTVVREEKVAPARLPEPERSLP